MDVLWNDWRISVYPYSIGTHHRLWYDFYLITKAKHFASNLNLFFYSTFLGRSMGWKL